MGVSPSKKTHARPNSGLARNLRKASPTTGSSKKYAPGSCSARLRIRRSSDCSSSLLAERKTTLATLLSTLFDQLRDQAGPASLVTRTNASAVVAMEILVEEQQVLPMRIALEQFGPTGYGTTTVLAAHKNMNQAARNFSCHFPKIRFAARARWKFNFEILTVIMVILLQGLDEEIVQRKPDRPAPVRISAKNTAARFGRLVIDTADMIVHLNFVGMIEVVARQRTHSVGGQKLGFVQHAAENALDLFAIGERKETANSARRALRHFDMLGNVSMIVDEPLHPAFETRQPIDDFRLQRFDSEQRNQPDHRTDL